MAILLRVPGRTQRRLEHLLLDVNGTLTDRGVLISGVAERLADLSRLIQIRLLTADTYGTLEQVRRDLGGLQAERVGRGEEKAAVAERLGAERCAAIGNGVNDELLVRRAGLGIAVVGPEGASPRTLLAADIVSNSVVSALDLLSDPHALAATLRP
jgi:soluble P-type ATPase